MPPAEPSKSCFIGHFDNEIEAVTPYDTAILPLADEFARLKCCRQAQLIWITRFCPGQSWSEKPLKTVRNQPVMYTAVRQARSQQRRKFKQYRAFWKLTIRSVADS